MAWTLKCPACQAEVQAEDAWVGRTVRCPVCQVAFVAHPDQPVLDDPPMTGITSSGRRSASPPSSRAEPPKEFDAGDEEVWEEERLPRRRRRNRGETNLGNAITTLVLGILSLVLSLSTLFTCFSFLLSFALSPAAIYVGMVDLAAIRRGELSEEAYSPTLVGLITAWLGLGISLLIVLSCGGFFGFTLLRRP